jgi:hypothetical protein
MTTDQIDLTDITIGQIVYIQATSDDTDLLAAVQALVDPATTSDDDAVTI